MNCKTTLNGKMERNSKKSYLLTDLYRNRHTNYQLADIISHVEVFVCDRRGSKFVQQKLRDAPENRREMVYKEMKPKLMALMMNKFANFVVQKLYEIATKKQREEIFEIIIKNFQSLCSDIYGCRVVQFVMESSTPSDQNRILFELQNKVITFARDQFAHHILIKCFVSHIYSPKDDLNFIVFEFADVIASECRHQYSCRVFQEILEYGTNLQKRLILDGILPAITFIASDRYGNYVIQNALRCESTDPAIQVYRAAIMTKITEQFWMMSQDKYASNVVEKFLDVEPIMHEVIAKIFFDLMLLPNDRIAYFCKQRFANYIVQKLVQKLDFLDRLQFEARIENYEENLIRHLGARKIIASLKQR